MRIWDKYVTQQCMEPMTTLCDDVWCDWKMSFKNFVLKFVYFKTVSDIKHDTSASFSNFTLLFH